MKRKTTKPARRLTKPSPPTHPHPGNAIVPPPTVDQANVAVDVLRTDRAAMELKRAADLVLHRFLRADLNQKASAWTAPVYTVGGAFTGHNTITST